MLLDPARVPFSTVHFILWPFSVINRNNNNNNKERKNKKNKEKKYIYKIKILRNMYIFFKNSHFQTVNTHVGSPRDFDSFLRSEL